MYNAIICRYHEIAIKGNNRREFERQLTGNMRYRLRLRNQNCRIRQVRGRIWLEPEDKTAFFSPEELTVIREELSRMFGLESFSPARLVATDEAAIVAAANELAEPFFAAALAAKEVVTFRIRARRSFKAFPLCSKDLEILLARTVADRVGWERLKVDLDHAEISIGCEVREEFTAIFVEKIHSPGGLPVGCNGKVLALLSSGIDSPVASYLAMKRGCAVEFLSFHSAPYTPPETTDKVKKLAGQLNEFQFPGKLHLCNLAPMQKEIRDCCTERNRTVLYRRAMFRIAEKVAKANGCLALLTGEAVGQVASQTLVNMSTIGAVTEMLVLRPLCGMDKIELIRLAEQIGTYETSIIHAPDSCTIFAPESPSTSVPRHVATAEEAKISDYDALIDRITAEIEVSSCRR